MSKGPNEVLRREREKRGWSQARVAEQIDTDAVNISRWERGYAMPSPYFREKLCLLFEKDAQDLGFLQEDQSRNELHLPSRISLSESALLQEPIEHQQKHQDSEVRDRLTRFLAALSYLFGWVSGLFLLLLKRDRFVRFHSLQSFLFFISSNFLSLVLLISLAFFAFLKKLPANNPVIISSVELALFLFFVLLNCFTLAVWIIGMFEAWQGRAYYFPFVGTLSENMIANRFRLRPTVTGNKRRSVAKETGS